METVRFRPVKRTALDGKTHWVIWDAKANGYSAYTCHGVYRLKRQAQFAIDLYERKGFYINRI